MTGPQSLVSTTDFIIMTPSHPTVDKFHSLLMDDDNFNEALMRVALDTVKYYNPGPLDDDDLKLAGELVGLVTVG